MLELSKVVKAGYSGWMDNWLLAMILKPFMAVAMLMFFWGVKVLILKCIPESKFKNALLSPISFKRKQSGDSGELLTLKGK